MIPYFEERKREVSAYLRELLAQKADSLGRVDPLGRDLCERLSSFALGGKMLRGGLVFLGCSVARGGKYSPEQGRLATAAGAAMELFQAGLLVHDDIMDRDTVRRGRKSLFYQYAERAEQAGVRDSYHLGESLGICAGDAAFFLGFEILGGLEVPPETRRGITALSARELQCVCVAQMQDVQTGAGGSTLNDEEILKLYLYKTGRYTFSLPLRVGAELAGAGEPLGEPLERLGETLGVIFQIKDDELGLFGNAAETGKPVGSDVKEGKKTLFHGYLLRRAGSAERERLRGIFGNSAIGEAEVRYVRELAEKLGIRTEVREHAERLAVSARTLIDQVTPAAHPDREVFLRLLDYSLDRTA